MDAFRRESLRNSLEHELEFQSKRRGLTPAGRVGWLAAVQVEYVERWLGFCSDPTISMQDLVNSELFAVIETGAGVLTSDLHGTPASADSIRCWLAFVACLNEIRDRADRRLTSRLEETVREFRATLPSVDL